MKTNLVKTTTAVMKMVSLRQLTSMPIWIVWRDLDSIYCPFQVHRLFAFSSDTVRGKAMPSLPRERMPHKLWSCLIKRFIPTSNSNKARALIVTGSSSTYNLRKHLSHHLHSNQRSRRGSWVRGVPQLTQYCTMMNKRTKASNLYCLPLRSRPSKRCTDLRSCCNAI